MTEKDLFISDLFFNMVSYYRHGSASRQNVSELAGIFSHTLSDMGIEKSPSELREDFFKRL
jgi:hypothetical protein